MLSENEGQTCWEVDWFGLWLQGDGEVELGGDLLHVLPVVVCVVFGVVLGLYLGLSLDELDILQHGWSVGLVLRASHVIGTRLHCILLFAIQ